MERYEKYRTEGLSAEERAQVDAIRERLKRTASLKVHIRLDLPEAGLSAVIALGVGRLYRRPHLYIEEVLVYPMGEVPGPVDVNKWRAVPLRRIEDVANLPRNRMRLMGLIDNKPEDAFVLDLDEPYEHEPPAPLPRRPRIGSYPDRFYQGVADHYRYHIALDQKPAKAMAKEYSVPVRTVHGWISEARRRGYLEPAPRQGRAGG